MFLFLANIIYIHTRITHTHTQTYLIYIHACIYKHHTHTHKHTYIYIHIPCTGKGLGYYISEDRRSIYCPTLSRHVGTSAKGVLKWVLRQAQKLDKKIEASLVPAKPSKTNSDSDHLLANCSQQARVVHFNTVQPARVACHRAGRNSIHRWNHRVKRYTPPGSGAGSEPDPAPTAGERQNPEKPLQISSPVHIPEALLMAVVQLPGSCWHLRKLFHDPCILSGYLSVGS
jgi:hypothetical protein